MLSPIRQRALARELKQLINQLPELGKPQRPNSSHQTWSPSGVITPPYVPIPLSPITPVPSVRVELIPTTRLSLIATTKDTGDIDMTITQDDKQINEQVNDEEEEELLPDSETIQQVKCRVQDTLIKFYQNHDQKLPRRIRISAHDLIPLAKNKLIDTVLYLHETNIIVEPDPEIGDDIQCDA